jgi:hypothetical protein
VFVFFLTALYLLEHVERDERMTTCSEAEIVMASVRIFSWHLH